MVAKGLADGSLQRYGGLIINTVTKQVVGLIRESNANSSVVNQRISGIEQTVQQIQGVVQATATAQAAAQGVLIITTGASILTLGITVIGFAVIAQRLKELEQRLQQAQELLNKINRKIDLGFYANFRAALDLAINAFTMSKPETRRSMAIQAINRFLEAEHIYTDYIDTELEQKSQIADEYILTLSLAYLAEARCYLELEEHETALRRFQEGEKVVRSRIQKYVDLLLTSNPAAYLQPCYKGEIDLSRLTRIYQWSNPTLNENSVFEMQRDNFVNFVREPNKWVASLPLAILNRIEVKGGWFGANEGNLMREAEKRLPQAMEVMESMIETNRRFEAYQLEIQAINQLGISFHDWLKLTPSETKPDEAELMYIIPDKPLDVVFAS